MEDWYSQHMMIKFRHQELENEYANPHLLRARALGDKKHAMPEVHQVFRRMMTALGKALETLGQVLQKKFQTC